jgi:cellulose synthase/poly-beta-1,6-N-acetylglucosamine synthase-like glycosyltransferase
MSAGVPTVAFMGAGGIPELLRDRSAGVSVPLGDADAMVRQMRALVVRVSPADRARLAERTRLDFEFGAYAAAVLRLAAPDVLDVTAVVPNFNYGRYLPGRIASIAAQTHPVREIIVLDDASTDGSEAAVREAAAKAGRKVCWVGSDRNSGSVFRQWRRAVDLARSEWLWIAEADDMAEPGFLASLAAALRDVPDGVMAFTDSRAVDAAGAPMWGDHQTYYARVGAPLLSQDGVHPAADVLRTCLSRRNLILNASAVLWRQDALRQALDRCGAELDSYTMAGDWRVYAEVLSAGGSVAYVAHPLNVHRRHAASVTHSLAPRRHLAEVSRMQRHMRGLLGADPALLAGQRRAMRETRATLMGAVAAPSPPGRGPR